jgi:hypothetical protein
MDQRPGLSFRLSLPLRAALGLGACPQWRRTAIGRGRRATTDRSLKRHPNVHFHFTPTHASWLK